MIQFFLNDRLINTTMSPGMVMVDFIRYHQHLTGTKIGCREGDCGACTVLSGELKEGRMHYSTVTSCLMPLANAAGKHIVTIEGININGLNAVQQAICEEGATQCGFCTPGIVMSLAGFCLQSEPASDNTREQPGSTQTAIASVDGNICRCTGYKSIERAASRVMALVQENHDMPTIPFLISRSVLPSYFGDIIKKLKSIYASSRKIEKAPTTTLHPNLHPVMVSGGTDLYVQQPENLVSCPAEFIFNRPELRGVSRQGDKCFIGAATTVSQLFGSSLMEDHFPGISRLIKLVSSTPIRNMATVAGNFINASPIGDLTILFLALDAKLVIKEGLSQRELPLQDFYKGYKILAKKTSEYLEQIWFPLPGSNTFFNFEKVSKRTHLDIATVNTALLITVENNIIKHARLSAGGVAAVPLLLTKASAFMVDKYLSADTVRKTIQHALSEVSPISDIRGTATYKRLLLQQLIKAHFITLFPSLDQEELLHA